MSFGVVIICSDKDISLAKGCLASVNYFMPGVATCLLLDGDADTSDAENTYGCKVLKRKDIKNDWLRNNSFGWSITKMIALWESPFENFLLLDADICLWGDIVKEVDWQNYDVVLDQPLYRYNEEAINTWFFDTVRLKELDKEFIPSKFENRYCCPGVYFFKKGCLDLELYKELTRLNKENPNFFKFGDMGMFNYMVLKSFEKGRIKLKNHPIQHICPDYTKKETKKIFPFINGVPAITQARAIHYNGDWKPYRKNILSYHQPMTFFRELFYKEAYPELKDKQVKSIMIKEDSVFEKKKTFKEKVKDVVRPFAKPVYDRLKSVSRK
jgi:hypothetical protein